MDRLVPLRRFGADHTLERKLMAQALSASAVARWRPSVERGVNTLLAGFFEWNDGERRS